MPYATDLVFPEALYFVKSASLPNRYYAVGEFRTGRPYRCECQAGARGRQCWHTEAVIAGMVAPARMKGRAVAGFVPAGIRAAADLYA